MNKHSSFFRFGTFVYHGRIPIIVLWILLILGCIPFMSHLMAPFKTTGFVDEKSNSVEVDKFLEKKLAFNKNRIIISYHSSQISTTNPLFIRKIRQSLSKLDAWTVEHDVVYPDSNNRQLSKDKHSGYVVIAFKTKTPLSPAQLTEFKTLVKKPSNMTLTYGGEPVFVDDINKQTQKDLYNADIVAAPISIAIMVLVFGSVVAALIPIALGGGCALVILTSLYFLGHAFDLSIFTINIALLLGLCLSLDYSLFMISRFRDELGKKKSVVDAISLTMATAGKAVFFSGLAVFISLAALLIFPINILFSIGVGGLVAVFVSVAMSVLLLPAILGVIHTGVNRWPISFFKPNGRHFWKWLAEKVVRRPLIFFLASLVFLLLSGSPFYKVIYGISDVTVLPDHSESRKFYELYKKQFNENELTPIILVLKSEQNILSRDTLAALYRFAKKISKKSSVYQVNGIVSTDKKITQNGYYQLYNTNKDDRDPAIRQLLKSSTRTHVTMMTVVSKYPANSAQTKDLIQQLKTMKPGKGLTLEVTGSPVNNLDVLTRISSLFPYALLWIVVLTYVVLLVLLRSVFLPLKAILMNMVSLSASYGVLVFIFQEGHFHQLLNFAPQGMLDTSLLIIIFCAIFGFSMDYEVFLLTRIKENYEKTRNNNQSIIFGIDQSSRIITSAAVIVIVLCGSFMVADVLMVKEFGLGIAVAIFVDAFLVRTILVPSTMVLVKELNWYLPKWLDRILPGKRSSLRSDTISKTKKTGV